MSERRSGERPLVFVIQTLNTWGGQERCTLEVASRLSHRWPVEIYSYTLEDRALGTPWGRMTWHRVRPSLRLPEMLRQSIFYAATFPPLKRRARHAPGRPLIHAAGACALVSDVVQVHFVQAAWRSRQRTLPAELRRSPRAAAATGPKASALGLYHRLLGAYDVEVERRVFTPEKTYVAVSRRVALELEEHFGIRDNVHVVHHGVDPERFHPPAPADEGRLEIRRRHGIAADEIVALFVGAYDRKGLPRVIDAVARLDPTLRSRLRLLAVGGGSAERFSAQASAAGIGDRLILAGIQKEIAPYYRAADLFVFPTLYEPFGMVILEAMASGLPCIVSRDAGAAELIAHGESGVLLDDPRDEKEIARAMARLALDDAARAAMGERAARIAAAKTWDQVAREYASVLEPLMSAGPTVR